MNIHEGMYYIKQDEWDRFLKSYKKYGFELNGRFIYPEAVTRPVSDTVWIQINISEPCVNMWDNEDKNDQREIWLCTKTEWETRGEAAKEKVTEFIMDLIEAGFVEGSD